MALETATIHRLRVLARVRSGSRDAQGRYPTDLVPGPWIPARVMERGSVAAKAVRRPTAPSDERVLRGYELIISGEDEAGNPVAKPTASVLVETDTSDGAGSDPLNSPTIALDGEPEVLTNGVDVLGFLAYGDVPLDRS